MQPKAKPGFSDQILKTVVMVRITGFEELIVVSPDQVVQFHVYVSQDVLDFVERAYDVL